MQVYSPLVQQLLDIGDCVVNNVSYQRLLKYLEEKKLPALSINDKRVINKIATGEYARKVSIDTRDAVMICADILYGKRQPKYSGTVALPSLVASGKRVHRTDPISYCKIVLALAVTLFGRYSTGKGHWDFYVVPEKCDDIFKVLLFIDNKDNWRRFVKEVANNGFASLEAWINNRLRINGTLLVYLLTRNKSMLVQLTPLTQLPVASFVIPGKPELRW